MDGLGPWASPFYIIDLKLGLYMNNNSRGAEWRSLDAPDLVIVVGGLIASRGEVLGSAPGGGISNFILVAVLACHDFYYN